MQGAHIVGPLLVRSCPSLEDMRYSNKDIENKKILHEIQSHCLRLLRFMYSFEKNRKSFKIIFPPEIFGAFIDVGNYQVNLKQYIPLLKKFNKLPTQALHLIRENFN
jgi:hypothetical protein